MPRILMVIQVIGAAAIGACSVDMSAQSRLSGEIHDKAVPYIKASHLKTCESKIAGNSKFKLAGPLRSDKRLTCTKVHPAMGDTAVAYYSAPLSSDGGMFEPKGSKFLWCRFSVANGNVTLDDWSVGMSTHPTVARMCGLKSFPY